MAYEPRGDYGDRGGGGQDGAFMKVRGRSESILLSLRYRVHILVFCYWRSLLAVLSN